MSSKSWYRSKMVWVNLLTAMVLLAVAPEFRALLGPESIKWVTAALAGVNILLRFLTSTELTK